jgi:hypothetical protein
MIINLPNNETATIITRKEMTERQNRAIARAFMSAAAVAQELAQKGFNEADPGTWGLADQLDDNKKELVNAYQEVLIANMVTEWSFKFPVTEENALDLPSETFSLLSNACYEEYNNATDFTPDGVTDPKALIVG